MVIDPFEKEYRDIPLWCVYGPSCFPTIFCCKIVDYTMKDSSMPIQAIWGFSIYGGIPGFRTLGGDLYDWINQQEDRSKNRPVFFNVQRV